MINRLNQLKEYLRLAQLQPELNKLYIEDLKTSIEIEQHKPQPFQVQTGFVNNANSYQGNNS